MKSAKFILAVMAAALLETFGSCGNNESGNNIKNGDSVMNKASNTSTADDQESVAAHLAKFDTLDFNIFSHRDWDRFHESHDKDIKVYFPDGHMTQGLDVHIKDMDAMFVYAPDTRITAHPIKIGSGNITAVTGIMEGTFTKPMP